MAQPLPKTRWATVRAHDTLRVIALRELGDALRWIDIAHLNRLRPPYIVDSVDAGDRARGTLIWGDRILIPTTATLPTPTALDTDLYGTDIALTTTGQLTVDDQGDYALVAGAENLETALLHRLDTATGELLAHPRYGCDAGAVLGFQMREIAVLMVTSAVRTAVLADPRVESILNMAVAVNGDTLSLAVTAKVIRQGQPVTLNYVFPLER